MAPPFHWELKLQQIDDKTSGRHIPPDIIFKIQEEGVLHELFAHKMVMGMVSPVFSLLRDVLLGGWEGC